MQKYDLAVIGAGLAGLSAAALAAQAGKRVMVTDPFSSAGGCLRPEERESFRFSGGHDLSYGFEAGGVLESLHASLGIAPAGPLQEVTYQVALPDRRITVAADPRITMEELRREFPAEIDQFARLYRDARAFALKTAKSRIARSVIGWRSAGSFLRSFKFSSGATAYLDVQSRFFFGRSLRELSLSSLVLLLDAAPRALAGGFSRFAAQLLSFIDERKGRVLMNEPWPELLFRGSRLSGMKTSDGPVELHSAIMNASWGRQERMVLFGMREMAMPVGMERNLLCLPDYSRPSDFFVLSLSGAGEGTPAGMRSGTATFHGQAWHDSPLAGLRDRIGSIIPFLSDFLVLFKERNTDEMRAPLPDRLLGKQRSASAGSLPLAIFPLRNLALIQDSPCCVPNGVLTARRFASKR